MVSVDIMSLAVNSAAATAQSCSCSSARFNVAERVITTQTLKSDKNILPKNYSVMINDECSVSTGLKGIDCTKFHDR